MGKNRATVVEKIKRDHRNVSHSLSCRSAFHQINLPDQFAEELTSVGGHFILYQGMKCLVGWLNFYNPKTPIEFWWMMMEHALLQVFPQSGNQTLLYEWGSLASWRGLPRPVRCYNIWRRASTQGPLLPEIHVAVVKSSQILPTLKEAFRITGVTRGLCGGDYHRPIPYCRYRNDPDHRRPWSGRTARLFD